MADIEVTISSEDQRFLDALERPEGLMPILAKNLEGAAGALVNEVKEYPPATEANQPGRFNKDTHKPMGFYERNRGWWYPIMRPKNVAGTSVIIGPYGGVARGRRRTMVMKTKYIGGGYLGVAGYKLRKTSQQLGENWVWTIEETPAEVKMTVGNTATYADWVQGYNQTEMMRKYEWTTIEDVLSGAFFAEVMRAREMEAFSEYYGLGGFGL